MALRLLAGGGSLGDHVLSSDGALLLVACVDSVLAYATATGEQAFRLQHAAPVSALCLQPGDESRLLTGSKDGQLTLWDLTTGAAVKQWSVGSPVESLVVSRTGDAGEEPSSGRARVKGVLAACTIPRQGLRNWHVFVAGPSGRAHAPALHPSAAAHVSCHWRQQQAGRLFTYDLASGAEAAGGRAKVSTARRLVVSAGPYPLSVPS